MAKQSGKYGYCKVGSTIIHVTKWSLKETGTNEETTTTESAGNVERTALLNDSSGSFEGFFDLSANIFATPPNIVINQTVTLLMFHGNPTDNKSFSVSALIQDVEIDSEVKGMVKYKASWQQASGGVTRPT